MVNSISIILWIFFCSSVTLKRGSLCSRAGGCGIRSARIGVVGSSGLGAILSHRCCIRVGGRSDSWLEVVVHVGDGLSVFLELFLDLVEADTGVLDAVDEEGLAGVRIFEWLCGVLLKLVLHGLHGVGDRIQSALHFDDSPCLCGLLSLDLRDLLIDLA